jgi:hypothetical protein
MPELEEELEERSDFADRSADQSGCLFVLSFVIKD